MTPTAGTRNRGLNWGERVVCGATNFLNPWRSQCQANLMLANLNRNSKAASSWERILRKPIFLLFRRFVIQMC